MRRQLLPGLLVLVLLLAAAFYMFREELVQPQYVHQGQRAAPPSASLPPDAQWLSLFDGQSLAGWTPKITGFPAGENYRDTFRVEQGAISVNYDGYPEWLGQYGHLFHEQPFSHYLLQLEYRFRGEQIDGGPGWAWRNSGVMVHAQRVDTMQLAQEFPISLEAQLLGADEGEQRATGNLCTPGTHVHMRGELHRFHCTRSLSASLSGDQWVRLELEVRGNQVLRHFINGELVMEYERPVLDDMAVLQEGHIALQSESHPVQFRNIRLYRLE